MRVNNSHCGFYYNVSTSYTQGKPVAAASLLKRRPLNAYITNLSVYRLTITKLPIDGDFLLINQPLSPQPTQIEAESQRTRNSRIRIVVTNITAAIAKKKNPDTKQFEGWIDLEQHDEEDADSIRFYKTNDGISNLFFFLCRRREMNYFFL